MRWYDPVTGRWLSKDPIGLSGGLNLYAFCEGDPVNKTDPDGMSWKGVLDLIKEVVKNLQRLIFGKLEETRGASAKRFATIVLL